MSSSQKIQVRFSSWVCTQGSYQRETLLPTLPFSMRSGQALFSVGHILVHCPAPAGLLPAGNFPWFAQTGSNAFADDASL